MKKESMTLKENKEWYMGCFGRREKYCDSIKISKKSFCNQNSKTVCAKLQSFF